MSTQFTDAFTRADSSSLGANYTTVINAFSVASNMAAAPASSGADYVNAVTPGAECWVQATAVTNVAAPGYLSLGLRLDTGTFNGYYVSWGSTGGASMYRMDGGAATILGASGFTSPGDGDVVRVTMRGSTLALYYNGTLQTTRTDATYSSAGRCFLLGADAAARFDDLSLGTLPTLSSPTGAATGSTTADVGATTDDATGTLYAVVTASGTPPTAAQIRAGQDSGGAAAAWSGSQAVSSTGAKTVGATGLTASTAYYAHLVHADDASNDSNIVSSSQFTTSAASGHPTMRRWGGVPGMTHRNIGRAWG